MGFAGDAGRPRSPVNPETTATARLDSPSRRALGSFETGLQLTGGPAPFNVVIVLRLAGGLSLESLRRALATLQRHHPLLRVRIVERVGRYGFEPGDASAIPLRLVDRDDEETWRSVAEEEVNSRLDAATGPALRCAYLQAAAVGGHSEVLLTLNHALIDAFSAITLLDQLLNLCDPDGSPLGPPQTALPPAAEALFPAPFRGVAGSAKLLGFVARQVADETRFRLRARGARLPPVHDSARCRLLPLQLDEAATAGLVRQTRRRRVTLHGACSAAMLLAVHRHLYRNESVLLRHFTFVDLRPRLRPGLPAAGLGCYIAMLRHTMTLAPDLGFWPLARAVTSRVSASLRRGDALSAVRLAPRMMRTILGQRRFRMGTTAVSYVGVRRLAPRYGAVRVRGLHGFVSNLPLGPQYTAQVRIFDRRLWWDIVYLDADLEPSQAQEISDEIADTLRFAAEKE